MQAPGNYTGSTLQALQDIAAPGAVFNSQGNTKNKYLSVGSVPSDNTGFPIRLNNATLVYIAITNSDNNATFTVEIFKFDGTTETLLATVDVVNSRNANFKPPSPIAVDFGTELRCKVNNVGQATNPVVTVFTAGDVP